MVDRRHSCDCLADQRGSLVHRWAWQTYTTHAYACYFGFTYGCRDTHTHLSAYGYRAANADRINENKKGVYRDACYSC